MVHVVSQLADPVTRRPHVPDNGTALPSSITGGRLIGIPKREPEQHHSDIIGERLAAEVPEQRIEIEVLRVPMLGDVVEQVLLLPALVGLVGLELFDEPSVYSSRP